MDTNNQFSSIDLVKVLMAIFVVAIHTKPLVGCDNLFVVNFFNAVVRLGVPFFFMTTGFFLGKKNISQSVHNKNSTLVKALIKAIKLYVCWTIIYLPITVYHFHEIEYPLKKAFIEFFRGFIFVGEQYNSWMLWYLLSLIISLLFIIIMYIYIKASDYAMVYVAFMFLVFGFVIDYYMQQVPYSSYLGAWGTILKIAASTIQSGRLFRGFFFVSTGFVLGKRNKSLKEKYNIAIGVGILAIILLSTVYINKVDCCDYIIDGLLMSLSSVLFFVFVLQLKFPQSGLYIYMREISKCVYFVHLYVWTIMCAIVYGEETYGLLPFILTSVISVLLGVGVCCYLSIGKRTNRISC